MSKNTLTIFVFYVKIGETLVWLTVEYFSKLHLFLLYYLIYPMKKKDFPIILLLPLLMFLGANCMYAQTGGTFPNTWIDYAKTYYKIKVAQNGIYRIPSSTLATIGLGANVGSDFSLYHNGQEVPLYVTTNGVLGSQDYIEFWGEKNDGAFDTQLYKQISHQPNAQESLFSDTSAYFLTVSPETTHRRYQSVENTIDNPPPKEDFFWYDSYVSYPEVHHEGAAFQIAGIRKTTSDFDAYEGFVSIIIAEDSSRTFNIPTKGIYTGGPNAIIRSRLIGRSDRVTTFADDHHVQIKLNGQDLENVLYDGYESLTVFDTVPASQLTSPTTALQYKSLTDVSSINKNSLAYIAVKYPHNFDFDNRRMFVFELDNTGSNKYLEITNFNGGTQPILYDITNQRRIQALTDNSSGATVYKFLLANVPGTNLTRKLVLINNDTACELGCQFPACNPSNCFLWTIPPAFIQAKQFVDYSLPAQQGDYVILTHSHFRQGDVDQVERYRQYRSSIEGGSHQVSVVDIDQLYDQFAWGIAKHPLSIRFFANYALQQWDIRPQYLLLLGKAVKYSNATNDATQYNYCYVPTYGIIPSDNMLTAANVNSFTAQIATGRVPALNANEVRIYLDKIIQYEANQNNPCTRTDRQWMKDAIHIAGGSDLSQSEDFLGKLAAYKSLYEDSLLGGRVIYTYNKITDETISEANLADFLNSGLGLITFFGHSAGNVWALDLGDPLQYQNHGKYPFILTASCFVGDIHNFVPSNTTQYGSRAMSESYVLADQLGSIGFLATASLGFPSWLDIFCGKFYREFSRNNYGTSAAQCMRTAIMELAAEYPTENGAKLTCQEYTFTGDPVLTIAAWKKPELIIENNADRTDAFLVPQTLTADLDSFALNIVLSNLGKSVLDSFNLYIDRQLPNGTHQIVTKRFPVPLYTDTLTVFIQMGDIDLVGGQNTFTITVDADAEIDEDCEDNNTLQMSTFVFSDLLIPVSPCNFSIVNNSKPIVLKASTGQPYSPETRTYLFQIDTTQTFNSPLLQQAAVPATAGVISWQPTLAWVANQVYYWQTAVAGQNDTIWKSNSFIYMPDSPEGFSQSHYQQYAQNDFVDMEVEAETQNLAFIESNNHILFANNYSSFSPISLTLNNQLLGSGTCLGEVGTCLGGIGFAIFKPDKTPIPLYSNKINTLLGCDGRGTFGNVQCNTLPTPLIEFKTDDLTQWEALAAFIQNNIPDNYYVLIYSINNHHAQFDAANPHQPILYQLFEQLGANTMTSIGNTTAFIVFGQKNNADFVPQVITATQLAQTINLSHNFMAKANNGQMKSVWVGPSLKWNEARYAFADDNGGNGTTEGDQTTINIYGLDADNNYNEVLLYPNIMPQNTLDLSALDARQFPFLRLEAQMKDTLNLTPAQIDYWRVWFDRYPEVSLDQQAFFNFHADTLFEGENVSLQMAITNVEVEDMDSLVVTYTIIDNNNAPHVIPTPKQAPLQGGQTAVLQFTHNSTGLLGNNVLVLELNPDEAQPEKFRFNNVLYLPFYVGNDRQNPYIDITIDGRHILDGELVSAKPEIEIALTDENPFLLLNDTAAFKLSLKYPDPNTLEPQTTAVPIYFNNDIVQFIPATQTAGDANKAKIILKPDLVQEGMYELAVDAKDRSNNIFAGREMLLRFKVQPKPMLSNMINYPNPFTTKTHFVFTLTGSEIPDNIYIQILTASGRVVREISRAELGNLHIGQNITDFAWDGTDQYGSPVANGVYLYRVSAKLNGQSITHYQTAADAYFNNHGWGKMYLMR